MLRLMNDEHAITRRVLGERVDHVRGVNRKVKGIKGSTSSTATSHAKFGLESSLSPTLSELRA